MNERKLPFKVKTCYAIGMLGNMLLLLTNAVFLLYFYTDVIGITPAAASVIIMIARIWDAVNDPMMGVMVDKKKSSEGKCRFFLRWFAIPGGVFFALSYFVPDLQGNAKLIWVLVTYILQGMGQTILSVPLFTLMARLSKDPVERAKLGQYQSVSSIIANLLVPAVTLPLVNIVGGGNMQKGFSVVAVIYGILFAACFLICYWGTKGYEAEEESEQEKEEPVTIQAILNALIHNKIALLAALCYLLYCVYSTLMGSSLVYYLMYNLKNTDLMGTYSILSTVTGFAPILLMVIMVKKLGNARTTIAACLVVIVGQVVRFVSHDQIMFCLYFGWAMEGVGVALFASMIRQCMIDSMVYGEWKTGVSNQAVLMSILTFAQKAGQAVGGVGAAALLSAFGYVANAEEQTEVVKRVFFTENVTLPMITFAISVLILLVIYRYEKRIPDMQREISQRKGQVYEAN